VNPALAEPAVVSWPAAAGSPRQAAVREAAALVESELARPPGESQAAAGGASADGAGRRDMPGAGDGAELSEPGRTGRDAGDIGELGEPDRALAGAWERDAGLLLTELAQRRAGAHNAVPLPRQLSVSSLVTMAADPDRLAQQIRRPMPRPPVPRARAADDPADDPDDGDLALLRERFEAGEWGDRWPVDVEVPFETLVAGRTVRGRIDAVFADPVSGDYDVIDWKTGEPPASAADPRAASVQLAAYRIAWARLAGVPLERVRAGFYYVRHDQMLRPADLLDETGLAALVEGVPLAHGAGSPG
jgi:DNA helicase-2/ATP-dependent DNA helicase PcrA